MNRDELLIKACGATPGYMAWYSVPSGTDRLSMAKAMLFKEVKLDDLSDDGLLAYIECLGGRDAWPRLNAAYLEARKS